MDKATLDLYVSILYLKQKLEVIEKILLDQEKLDKEKKEE